MKKWLLAASLLSSATFADVAVIVHPSNTDTLDNVTISRLFLNKMKAFPNGGRAEPMALPEGAPQTEIFNQQILGKNASQLTAFWSKLVFTGKGQPPKSHKDSQTLMSAVAVEPNAIGYVDSAVVDDSVRVVATLK